MWTRPPPGGGSLVHIGWVPTPVGNKKTKQSAWFCSHRAFYFTTLILTAYRPHPMWTRTPPMGGYESTLESRFPMWTRHPLRTPPSPHWRTKPNASSVLLPTHLCRRCLGKLLTFASCIIRSNLCDAWSATCVCATSFGSFQALRSTLLLDA